MKQLHTIKFLFFLKGWFLYSLMLLSANVQGQCFDCGFSIGDHVEDYITDMDRAADGMVLTLNLFQGWTSEIRKYDFQCNLLWNYEFISEEFNSSYRLHLAQSSIDPEGNIYNIAAVSERETLNIEGFLFRRGFNLVKFNSNGVIQWVKYIGKAPYNGLEVQAEYGTVRLSGFLYNVGDNALELMPQDTKEFFVAQLDATGNVLNAQLFGREVLYESWDAQEDNSGNIYVSGTRHAGSELIPVIVKIGPDLSIEWSLDLPDTLTGEVLSPKSLHFNKLNGRLYIWSKFQNELYWGNDCDMSSLILEVFVEDGSFGNRLVLDNCGFLTQVQNGSGDWEQRSFMSNDENYLYVLSSFRKEFELGAEVLTTSQTTEANYNSDLALYRLDLATFTPELLFRSTGVSQYASAPYRDLAGPIHIVGNAAYITSVFESTSILINGNSIINDSGNANRDVLFYKFLLDQSSTGSSIVYHNSCLSEETAFEVEGTFDSVEWDFGDPASGINNASSLTNPTHIYSLSGTYTVSVTVTCGTETETKEIEIQVTGKPQINNINDLQACEDISGGGISSTFNTEGLNTLLIGNQTEVEIRYFDQEGNPLPFPLPNLLSNEALSGNTLIARAYYKDNPECYAETTIGLQVLSLPQFGTIQDIVVCDEDNDGFAVFDLTSFDRSLGLSDQGFEVVFYDSSGATIPPAILDHFINLEPNVDLVQMVVTNPTSRCETIREIMLNVHLSPVPYPIPDLLGCDDNNDGFSDSFDTSQIERLVLNGQSGLVVGYYLDGALLPDGLPNPLSNSIPYRQQLIIRLTDEITGCYSESMLELRTVSQPELNDLPPQYTCDEGEGYGVFDTTQWIDQIIQETTGVDIKFYDSNGTMLPNPLPADFRNTTPFQQNLRVTAQFSLDPNCYSESFIELYVNDAPDIGLEDSYVICDSQSTLPLAVDSSFESVIWLDNDGQVVSVSNQHEFEEEGRYSVTVGFTKNGVYCEQVSQFELFRSKPPKIESVNSGGWGNNYLRVIASGDGVLEYSIDGINFQDENEFKDILGGTYRVWVRDKEGCGEDVQPIAIIDYPKFFTPNNDGHNDFWQIVGLSDYPGARIEIYDRYGKKIAEMSGESKGWDGLFKGQDMPESDYWFSIEFQNGFTRTGHFSLKR